MKVSTRGRYALRLMLDLALNNTGEPVRLKAGGGCAGGKKKCMV